MYVKIEPSGCNVRKGMVEVRLCMYLDSMDYGYEKHYVEVDGAWQNNPFHNHFIQVEPDTTDKEIMDIAEAFLHEAYAKWAQEQELDLKNNSLPFKFPEVITVDRNLACMQRVEQVKNIKTTRKV